MIPDDLSNPVAPPHPFEDARLAAVREFAPFTRENDRAMRALAREALGICKASAAMVSLMDADEERFLATVGMPARPAPRRDSLCAHVILEPHPVVLEDLTLDPRFASLPYVVGPPFVRFFAGAPILDASGLPLGAVCVRDAQPHKLSSRCLLAFAHLAASASAVLETRLLFASTRSRLMPVEVTRVDQTRIDDLLALLVETRPACV